MTSEIFQDQMESAWEYHQAEDIRSKSGFQNIRDPGPISGAMSSNDLKMLKKKFSFLSEYSDEFIKATGVEVLIKTETSARKLLEMDRSRKAEDKLLTNRESSQTINVEGGEDNRQDKLHPARFLPGPTCTQGKVWLQAREVLGGPGHPPVSTYDMASFGLGGCTSARGWIEIHDLSSTSISVKMFAMGNFKEKEKNSQDSEFAELEDISELKSALRVLRGAMVCVHPWNRSVDALESFYMQTNYCSKDLAGVAKQVNILTKFTDYVLAENATRWRDQEQFLTTRDLRGTWADFFSQKSTTFSKKPEFQGKNNFSRNNSYSGGRGGGYSGGSYTTSGGQQCNNSLGVPNLLFKEDVCVLWNLGKCIKAPGTCTTKRGVPLRHVCNYRQNWNNPTSYCGQNHAAFLFHRM